MTFIVALKYPGTCVNAYLVFEQNRNTIVQTFLDAIYCHANYTYISDTQMNHNMFDTFHTFDI